MVAMRRLQSRDASSVFSPFYENYVADTILSGAEPIYVSLNPPEFRFDEADLKRRLPRNPKRDPVQPVNPSGGCSRVRSWKPSRAWPRGRRLLSSLDGSTRHRVCPHTATPTSRRCQGWTADH